MEEIYNVIRYLVAGTRIYMAVADGSTAKKERTTFMMSSLMALINGNILFSIPVQSGCYYPLSVGTKLEIYFFMGNGRYYFETEVLGRVKYGEIPVLRCAMPDVMIRTDNRRHYRVEVALPLKLSKKHIGQVESNQSEVKVTINEYDARCVDISAGGLQIAPTEFDDIPLSVGDIIDIDFLSTVPGLTSVRGEVVRMPNKKQGWGLRFIDMNLADSDKLTKYIFNRQISDKHRKHMPFRG